jgi:uncharacterized protein
MATVADTGFVVGLAIVTDARHTECLSVYRKQREIFLPQTVLAEVAYLLTRGGGNRAIARFLMDLARTKYRLIPLDPADVIRSAELLQQYADARIDFVDTTVIAMAERLRAETILTTDRRDFEIVRPKNVKRFELLP